MTSTVTQLQLRRGTSTQISTAFTPAAGELIADSSHNRLILGDGSQLGGWPQAALADAFFLRFDVPSINFNSTGDTKIPISGASNFPPNCTRYRVNTAVLSNPSTTMGTANYGIYTSSGGAGSTIIAANTLTFTSTADGTNGNVVAPAVVNATGTSYSLTGFPNLFVHVVTPQSSAATANLTLQIIPLL